MTLNVEVLSQSFDRIKLHATEFTSSFYANLFTAYPQVQSFNINVAREQKLLSALGSIIESLRQPDVLTDTLREIGVRHLKQGILPTHYPIVGYCC